MEDEMQICIYTVTLIALQLTCIFLQGYYLSVYTCHLGSLGSTPGAKSAGCDGLLWQLRGHRDCPAHVGTFGRILRLGMDFLRFRKCRSSLVHGLVVDRPRLSRRRSTHLGSGSNFGLSIG